MPPFLEASLRSARPACILPFLLGMTLALWTGCAHTDQYHIPIVSLHAVPDPIRQVAEQTAAGRTIQKINRLPFQHGTVYRVYISDKKGPQQLTLDAHGHILENAVAVPFETLPPAVKTASQTAVVGQLQLCRRSAIHPEIYLLDYLLGGEEPVYATIEQNGLVQAVTGYSLEDPD